MTALAPALRLPSGVTTLLFVLGLVSPSGARTRRAVGAFCRQGLAPIPAPTDCQLPKDPRHASWTTSAVHLRASDSAMHEYLGPLSYGPTDRI